MAKADGSPTPGMDPSLKALRKRIEHIDKALLSENAALPNPRGVSPDLIAAVRDTHEPARIGLWLRPNEESS